MKKETTTTKESQKKAPKRILKKEPTDLPIAECKDQILLRNVPCEVIQRINSKKIEIMKNNPHRTNVSHSEAIFKLILKS